MSDRILQIRQIWQYPLFHPQPDSLMLLQAGDGGPYFSSQVSDFIKVALTSANPINIAGQVFCSDLGLVPTGVIGWGTDPNSNTLYGPALRGALGFSPNAGWRFDYANPQGAVTLMKLTPAGQLELPFGTVTVARPPFHDNEVATAGWVSDNTVGSFNGRNGDVFLNSTDIDIALGICPPDRVATQSWVNAAICGAIQQFYLISPFVYSFNGRSGDICLNADDITFACTQPGAAPRSNSPVLGDASGRIATTLFVDESLQDLEQKLLGEIAGAVDLSLYAPLDSPDFSGNPTAPTANPGTSTGQIATTAFVQAAVAASTSGVASWNGRTGAVTMAPADIQAAGGAVISSPGFIGTPTAPTAAPGTSTTQLATTAFVTNAIAAIGAGVVSFNGRAGAVTLTTADVTGAGGAPVNAPSFTGVVTAPTPAPATNNTTVATTAYVTAAIAAMGAGVTSFNSRTGAVTLQNNDVSAAGGALVASPVFTGVPAAPTAAPGTSTTQLATTAFVTAAIAAGVAGVTSFNTRTGAVTLTTGDITGAGGAPVASPALTGTPTAPTAAAASSDTTIATTAFVHAVIGAAAGVTSFNTRTGAVTLSGADVSAAGGALVASPTFTGVPAAPTAVPGTSTTQLATTAFVAAAVAAGVSSFNGRNGAVTLTSADVTGAGGALLASPAFSGTPNAPTPTAGTNNTQIATTAFVAASITTATGVKSVKIQHFTGSSTYTPSAGLIACVIECVGGGGGGAGCLNAPSACAVSGGGGSGGYSRRLATAAQVGASQVVTVGVGGALGIAGANNGGAGGATSVGSLCVANGGLGSVAMGASGQGWVDKGGLGASTTGAVGDVVCAGNPGTPGICFAISGGSTHISVGGTGGSSCFGGAGLNVGSAGNAQAGTDGQNGSGGGGSACADFNAGANGGNGGAGLVIITEFCSQ